MGGYGAGSGGDDAHSAYGAHGSGYGGGGGDPYGPEDGSGAGPEGGSAHAGGAGGDGLLPMLPPPGAPVWQEEHIVKPPGGWTVYMHPPAGIPWSTGSPFFWPLVNSGIPFVKHGRAGRPHKRLMWLDISDPDVPVLCWADTDHVPVGPGGSTAPTGTGKGAGGGVAVKDKDRIELREIIDIKAGCVSAPLQRTGSKAKEDLYFSFSADKRTLDVEVISKECRDWLFRKFADLFQAYAKAQTEGRHGAGKTLRVLELMDGPAMLRQALTAVQSGAPGAAGPLVPDGSAIDYTGQEGGPEGPGPSAAPLLSPAPRSARARSPGRGGMGAPGSAVGGGYGSSAGGGYGSGAGDMGGAGPSGGYWGGAAPVSAAPLASPMVGAARGRGSGMHGAGGSAYGSMGGGPAGMPTPSGRYGGYSARGAPGY